MRRRPAYVLVAAALVTACAAETGTPVKPGAPPKTGTAPGGTTRRPPATSEEALPEDEPRETDTAEQQANGTCEDGCRAKAGAKLAAIDAKYESCTAACTTTSCRDACDDRFVGACQEVAGCSAFVACMNACE